MKLEGRGDKISIIAGDLDAVLSEFNKRSGQKISQDREALNNTVRQPDPIDISRSLSDNSRLHLLLKCTWKSHKDILSHKVIPDKLERTEIIQSILSDHNAIKPEIKSKKISGMPPKYLEGKNSSQRGSPTGMQKTF